MCHLVLMAPLLGLGLFFILPLKVAFAAYLVVLIATSVLYWVIYRAHRREVQMGPETLPGSLGTIVWVRPQGLIVRLGAEYWTADLRDVSGRVVPPGASGSSEGGLIEVVGCRNNRLLVIARDDASPP